jgi:hypothetical protein
MSVPLDSARNRNLYYFGGRKTAAATLTHDASNEADPDLRLRSDPAVDGYGDGRAESQKAVSRVQHVRQERDVMRSLTQHQQCGQYDIAKIMYTSNVPECAGVGDERHCAQ